ncbi:MAG: InlB B-repeat-containing protein [Clostridiales bacterium]|nr:InlB B-repeat-containing protein [Clostridiales bacterium]
MMGRMKRITVALILTLAITITAMPVQLLSCLTGKSGVVNAAGGVQYTEIGTNSQNTYQSYYCPLCLYYDYGFSEQIYTKDELSGVSTISAMGFKINKAASKNATGDIYLVNTDKSSFSNTGDVVLLDDATLVYSGWMETSKTGWMYVQLDRSFTRDTNKNLMVIVINKTGNYTDDYVIFDCYGGSSDCAMFRILDGSEVNPGDLTGTSSSVGYKNKLRLFSSPIPKYTLTYDFNNNTGTSIDVSFFAVDLDAHVGDITPAYAGHTFRCWNSDRNGNGTRYYPGDEIEMTGNVTLYAEWNDADTITYMANDGTNNSSSQAYDPTTQVKLKGKIFSRDGYACTGWNTDPQGNGTHYDSGASISVTGNLTLYAEWVALKKITYVANNGTNTAFEQLFNPTEEVTLQEKIFSRDGYIFAGWNTDRNGNGIHYNAGESVALTGDTTLYAEWTGRKTITYKANNGTNASFEQTFDPTEEVKLAGKIFSRDGYTLIGWSTASNGSGTVYGCNEPFTLNSDLTLYAMWKSENTSFVVGKTETTANGLPLCVDYKYSFSEQIYPAEEIGGCSKIEAIAFNVENEMSIPRRGRLYLMDTTLTELSSSDEAQVLKNAVKVFDGTFPFDDIGWCVIPFERTYNHDTTKNLLVILIDETGKYTYAHTYFSVYQTNGNATKAYYTDVQPIEPGKADSEIVKTGTSYTRNTLKIYAADGTSFVTLKSNGSDDSDIRYPVSNMTELTLPENPFTRAGYEFAGWNTRADGKGTSYSNHETISISGGMVLYAQWQRGNQVLYHSNDGSDQTFAEELNQGSVKTADNPYFRPHYIFAGWNTRADGKGVSYMPGQVIGTQNGIELYAQWEYAVYYDFSSNPEGDGWIFVDHDGDRYNWKTGFNSDRKVHSGQEEDGSVIYSESYVSGGALHPDNWAIAPAGVVAPNGAKTVAVWAIGQDGTYFRERFALYAAEVKNVDLTKDIDPTKWTQISPIYTTTTDWAEYTGDLSSFSGKNVYVAIRHFDVTDEYSMNIDDVALPFLMAEDVFAEKLAGYTVSLDGDIAMNFYMELDQSVLESATAKMVFTIPNGSNTDTQTIMVSEVADKPVEMNGKTYYVFKCKVAAKDMTGTITAQILDTDLEGNLYTYSVKEYASYLLSAKEGTYDAKTIRLVKALLNYGASAQMYFTVNTDNLANSELSAQDKNLSAVTAAMINKPYDPSGTTLPAGVSFEGSTLSLKSETTLSLYFKSDAKLTFNCGSKPVQKSTQDGYQIARIREINAAELDEDRVLTVTVNGVNYKVTYNPMTYCYNVLSDNSYGEDAQNFCRALYLFHKAFMACL